MTDARLARQSTRVAIVSGGDAQVAREQVRVAFLTSSTVVLPGGISGSITGGGVWLTAARAAIGHEAAESGIYFCHVGRDDPGVFDVEVAWAPGGPSKSHSATLWKVTGYADNLPERMAALSAAWRFGITSDNPDPGYEPDGSPPGKGPWQFPIQDNRYTVVRPVVPGEITIGQSLAESPTGPWGATFDPTASGSWVVPAEIVDLFDVSWTAATREAYGGHNVALDEVNLGPDDIQSTQAAAVMEPIRPDTFGWRVADYGIHAEPGTLLPGGIVTGSFYGAPNSTIVVFVGVEVGIDVSDDISVDSAQLAFSRCFVEPWDTLSHAQGAMFWAKTGSEPWPVDVDILFEMSWGLQPIEKIYWLAYEITNGGDVRGVAGGVRGDHTIGSVDGVGILALDVPPLADSVVLAFIGVGVSAFNADSGATPGTGWTEEIEVIPDALAWFQAQSRTGSTDDIVRWDDMYDGATSLGKSAMLLAVEVTPGPDFSFWNDTLNGLYVGGSRDAFNGPIYWAQRRDGTDPNAGTIVWTMEPDDVVILP